MSELNKYSKTLTQDETQPAAQAMLYGYFLVHSVLVLYRVKCDSLKFPAALVPAVIPAPVAPQVNGCCSLLQTIVKAGIGITSSGLIFS